MKKTTVLARLRRSMLPGFSATAPAMFAVSAAVPGGPVARAFSAARSGDRGLLPALLMATVAADRPGTGGSGGRAAAGADAVVDTRFIGGVRGVPPRGRSA